MKLRGKHKKHVRLEILSQHRINGKIFFTHVWRWIVAPSKKYFEYYSHDFMNSHAIYLN